MNKKKQNKKTSSPRRGNGRVYQMEETTVPKVISDPATGHILGLPVAKIAPPAESICDKARRLANEAEETKKKERAEHELAFMKKMFETEDLAGAGVVMDKVREDGTIEYLICGRRWVYERECIGFNQKGACYFECLVNIDQYLGFCLTGDYSCKADTFKDFGLLLQRMDKREAELRAKYPDSWWGRLKAWWHQFSIF